MVEKLCPVGQVVSREELAGMTRLERGMTESILTKLTRERGVEWVE